MEAHPPLLQQQRVTQCTLQPSSYDPSTFPWCQNKHRRQRLTFPAHFSSSKAYKPGICMAVLHTKQSFKLTCPEWRLTLVQQVWCRTQNLKWKTLSSFTFNSILVVCPCHSWLEWNRKGMTSSQFFIKCAPFYICVSSWFVARVLLLTQYTWLHSGLHHKKWSLHLQCTIKCSVQAIADATGCDSFN